MSEANVPGPPGPPARVGLADGQKVSLGCGTLILIALIVMFFSREGVDDVEKEVRALRAEVTELKEAVDAQTAEIKSLTEKLERAAPAR